MASVNKAILVGNLGRDPELRYTPSGKAVAKFSIATVEKWKTGDGEKQEKTEWHNVVAWGRLAEICGQYLKKGSPVYIEGRIETRKWDDKDGNKRNATEIVANQLQMLGKKSDSEAPASAPPAESAQPAASPDNTGSQPPQQEPVDNSGDDDDLPF